MGPLTVYSFIPRKHTASWYYRIQVPFETCVDLGLPIQCKVDTDDAAISPTSHIEALATCDVAVLYTPVGTVTLNQIAQIQSLVPSKVDGGWKWPPAMIVDSDDNIFNVNPFNPAFKTLGIRDPDGNEIPVGHLIGAVEDGEKKVLWQDGVNGFDIARNRGTIATYRKIVEAVDCFTCTTPHIAEAMRREIIPARTEVFPNAVRMDHYEQLDLVTDPNKVVIIWQGGGAHHEDFWGLREAFGDISRRYPHVHWVVWGAMYPWAMDQIPAERMRHLKWCPYPEYRLRSVMFHADINICPLSDNRFNRCRSAIKFYERTVQKVPAATLAQETGAYKDEIIPEQTGLLFSDPQSFKDQLSRLIEDATLRKTLAQNAKDWVNENRNALKIAPKWFAFIEELSRKRQRVQPHMPDAAWDKLVADEKAKEEAQKAVQEPQGAAV